MAQPRRNRVDPLGDLHAVTARGLFTGNRGCLLDDHGRLTRHHNGSLWIICRTEYRDWRHPLDAPRTWTPLFFLDDAVALAAGHRPCGLCRRPQYQSYRDAVTASVGADRPVLAHQLNRMLVAERLDARRGPGRTRRRGLDRAGDRLLHRSPVDRLPDGTVIIDPVSGRPHLLGHDHQRRFGFEGWGPATDRPAAEEVDVVTPPTSVAALTHGFRPQLHHSALG